jgi:AbrB family looped-hinge helix DNA binding protein
MRTTVDKTGRLVIPRRLREQIGLAAGGPVEVELDGAAIRIQPIVGAELLDEDGLLLLPATGSTLDGALVADLIDADRHRR